MRSSRSFIVLLAALAVVGACSEGGPSNGTGTTGTGSSGTTQTGAETSTPCPFEDFADRATPLVQVQSPSASSPIELTERLRLPCVTNVAVNQGGAADVEFGRTTRCQIFQDQPGKVARITTRDPKAALFRMGGGRALCTMTEPGKVIELCGQGVLLINEPMQTGPTCDPDPVFSVAAYAGSVKVIDPNGEEFMVLPGTALVHSFETGESRIENANFNPPDEALFAQQAAALGLQPLLRRAPEVDSDGGLLVSTDGEWSAAPPLGFTYQWQGSCSSFDDDATCTDIAGATEATYTPSESDCPAVRVVVTAANASGSTQSDSRPFDLDIVGLCSSTTTSATGATASPS